MSVAERVTTYRDNMRAAGYRPIQLWVPDVRSSAVARLIAQQGRRVARADAQDGSLQWLDANNAELWADQS